jgi:hypothetical protein
VAVACITAAFALSGCGGGGSGTPVIQIANTPDLIHGTLLTATGTRAVGYVVKYDNLTGVNLQTTTDAQGNFTLTIPVTEVTSSDYLSIYSPTGAFVDWEAIALNGDGGQTVTPTITLPGAPPPPPPAIGTSV